MPFSSSPSGFESPQEGFQTEAVVKWFNLTKGFGFVALTDGSPDAFLHMSVLGRAGLEQVAEGTKMLVEIGAGPKGRQVLQVLQVLGVAEVPPGPGGGGRAAPSGPEAELDGTIKWFKPDKGFGFATPDDGGRDVFIHRSVLLRAGLQQIDPGQKVRMRVQNSAKGREATAVEVV